MGFDTKLLFGGVLFLIVFGVILAVGSQTLDQTKTTLEVTTAANAVNESWTGATNTTAYTASNVPVTSWTQVQNTTGTVLAAANYTTSGNTIILTGAGNATFGGQNLLVDYAYNFQQDTVSSNNTDDALSGISKTSDFAPVVGIVLAALILLGMVLMIGKNT